MCGRTGLGMNKTSLRCACSFKNKDSKYEKPEWLDEHNDGKEFTPSYNIAPTDITPVLVSSSRFKNTESSRILKPMMWGIIPPWHKGDYKNHNLSTNNCRLEGIKDSKLYGPALKKGGRCIVVVEGFYEWQTTKKNAKTKQPYYIYAQQKENIKMDDPTTWSEEFDYNTGWQGIKLLHLAGIYSVWKNEGTVIYAYSVITMNSNETLNWLHHRMPAVLDTQEQVNAWLDIDNVDTDNALQYLYPTKLLSWHPVSTAVNNSRNKSFDCNKKIQLETKKDKPQKTLTCWFSKAEKKKSSETFTNEAKKRKTSP